MTTEKGKIRDAVIQVLTDASSSLSVSEIISRVKPILGNDVPQSSVRSSLQLQAKSPNSPIVRVGRGIYALYGFSDTYSTDFSRFCYGKAELLFGDSLQVMDKMPECSIHAIVTDPPYGFVEYEKDQLFKMRNGKGGVWRIPPSFDGNKRMPLPRFTTLTDSDLEYISTYFQAIGNTLMRVLVPGANVVVASNPLVCHIVTSSLERAGLEPRGQIIRLVQTMRGGDRPKGHESEYSDVSVMPRSQWEPWIIVRKPLDGTVAHNLSKWGVGGWLRISDDLPFGDVIKSSPTHKSERALANHPSLKPQAFLRQVVRSVLPLGTGVVLDPYAGSGSTLAAAEYCGYKSIGIERDPEYFKMAQEAIPQLTMLNR